MVVGMDAMAKRRDSSRLASVSTLASSAVPIRSAATLSTTGAIILHGPHQSA